MQIKRAAVSRHECGQFAVAALAHSARQIDCSKPRRDGGRWEGAVKQGTAGDAGPDLCPPLPYRAWGAELSRAPLRSLYVAVAGNLARDVGRIFSGGWRFVELAQ